MKTIVLLTIFSFLLPVYAFANPAETTIPPKNAMSAGFSRSTVKFFDEELPDHPIGFNLKYRRDFNSEYGIITSFTYSRLNKKYLIDPKTPLDVKLKLNYYSILLGPTLRANKYFSVYGLFGAAQGRAKITSNYPDSNVSQDKLEVAYGGGVQIDINEYVTLDVSYEYAKLNETKTDTLTLGVGYRF